MDLTNASIAQIRDAVRAKRVSAVEVVRHFRDRIDRLDKKLNSFVTLNERAMQSAAAVDAKIQAGQDPGALAGVPVAVKDLICTRGLRTTACSNMLRDFVPPYSATLVSRLEESGAIILGKTNLDEFAMGSSNESSAFGPCRNPWNLDYVPGGSSGGSAAAVAARLAPLAIGTDTGGSIRQPSSFCGLNGIKPTYGRVSRYGVIAFASSLDQAGPMSQSVSDCALALEVIAGQCRRDSTSATVSVPRWSQLLKSDLRGMRIGLPVEYFAQKIEPDVDRCVQNAIEAVRAAGAEIVEVSLAMVKHAVPVYYLVATSEASSNLARYDGVRYGHRAKGAEVYQLEEMYRRSRGEGFGAEVKRRIMLGTYALSSGYYEAYFLKAAKVRRLLRDEFFRAFKSCDVILSPVTTSAAFKLGDRSEDPLEMYMNDIFTTSTNLAGLPGMSVPAGFSAGGLPIGVQLLAAHFNEQAIFDVGNIINQAQLASGRVPNVI